MEYVEGRDLQHMVKQDGPLDYAAAADYIRQAAEGLAHAHAGRPDPPRRQTGQPAGRPAKTWSKCSIWAWRSSPTRTASLTVAFDENVLGTADYLAPNRR